MSEKSETPALTSHRVKRCSGYNLIVLFDP